MEKRVQVDQELRAISESHKCVIKFQTRTWPYEPTQKKVFKYGDRRLRGDDCIRNKEQIDDKVVFCK